VSAPRVLFLASDPGGVGGIQRYGTWLIDALSQVGPLDVVDLAIARRGGRVGALGAGLEAWARCRPDLVVVGHVSFGPAALPQLASGRAAVVVAYGIEVWGAPSRRIDATLRAATEVWPISTFTAHEVARRAPAARVGPVLGGGVEDSFFVDEIGAPGPSARDGVLRVLVVTRLDDLAYKGIDTCLDALQRLDAGADIELRIVGDGPAARELSALVRSRGLERQVCQLGALDDDTLRDEYRRADVVVLLSRFRRGDQPRGEGLGIVPLEAGAAGTPAIVSAIGGTVDTVDDGRTGWWLDPDDVAGLAALLGDLAHESTPLRERGAAARQFVRDVHGRAAFQQRIRDAVAEVMS
jgi:glycosyltransferase involved in cell wall biosynthesis